jgi:flagellar biosynthesis protein
MPEAKGSRRRAVALRYREAADSAPTVVAKGKGRVAERILELAAEADIPVTEDPSLVEVLVKLDLNVSVPPELYAALAEIFAWAYRQDQSYAGRAAASRSRLAAGQSDELS